MSDYDICSLENKNRYQFFIKGLRFSGTKSTCIQYMYILCNPNLEKVTEEEKIFGNKA